MQFDAAARRVGAWLHRLYFWLRLKRFFTRAAPWLLVAATLLPTLALLGVIQGEREVVALAKLPEWRAVNLAPQRLATPPQRVLLDAIIFWFMISYVAVPGLVLAARGARTLAERRGGTIVLS